MLLNTQKPLSKQCPYYHISPPWGHVHIIFALQLYSPSPNSFYSSFSPSFACPCFPLMCKSHISSTRRSSFKTTTVSPPLEDFSSNLCPPPQRNLILLYEVYSPPSPTSSARNINISGLYESPLVSIRPPYNALRPLSFVDEYPTVFHIKRFWTECHIPFGQLAGRINFDSVKG